MKTTKTLTRIVVTRLIWRDRHDGCRRNHFVKVVGWCAFREVVGAKVVTLLIGMNLGRWEGEEEESCEFGKHDVIDLDDDDLSISPKRLIYVSILHVLEFIFLHTTSRQIKNDLIWVHNNFEYYSSVCETMFGFTIILRVLFLSCVGFGLIWVTDMRKLKVVCMVWYLILRYPKTRDINFLF